MVFSTLSLEVCAKDYTTSGEKARHFVGFRVDAGEANHLNTSKDDRAFCKAGATTGVGFRYEVRYRKWSFGIGLDGDYQYLTDTIPTLSDVFQRTDRNGEPVTYEYVYESYRQHNHVAILSIPIYFGRDLGDWAYLHAGGRVSLPLWSRYDVESEMYTQGTYPWGIEPVRSEGGNDFSDMGYYPLQPVTYRSTYKDYLRAGAYIEAGGYLPLPGDENEAGKIRLRLGLYGSVNWKIGVSSRQAVTDYSSVDADPQTQSIDNFKETMRYNALSTTHTYAALPLNLEVGIRMTCLFDVTPRHKLCRCDAF